MVAPRNLEPSWDNGRMSKTRENWLFGLGLIGGIASTVTILSYFGITPKALTNGGTHIYAGLVWAILLFIFSVGFSSYGLFLVNKRPNAEVARRLPLDKPLPQGVMGDFADVTIQNADYGSDEIRLDALAGLHAMLSDNKYRLPDGATCLPVQSLPLVGRDPHEGIYKYLRVTFSVKLHEAKALTIRPASRFVGIAAFN